MIDETELRNRVDDEKYQDANTLTKPILAYILDRYKNEVGDAMDSMDDWVKKYMGKFLLLGKDLTPLGIELSQWDYEVFMQVKNSGEVGFVRQAAQRQAGFFKDIIVEDYKLNVPKSRVCITFARYNDVYRWFNFLVKQSEEVLLIADNKRDWKTYLTSKYETKLIKEMDEKSYISIKRKG